MHTLYSLFPVLLLQVLDTFKDGIHGFLFVFNMGNPRFTQEEKDAFDEIEQVGEIENIFEFSNI